MNTYVREHATFGQAWQKLLHMLTTVPAPVRARGFAALERTNVVLSVRDGLANILVSPTRNLNYRFMVAEWLWIWFGHDDVETITRYNKRIAAFSDNGIDFNGGYGPPITQQWGHVVHTLSHDPDSRQAVIQIYRMPTGPTKDVPCTLAVQFLLRDGAMHTIVSMRSSDIWLGLPYDFFNFSMLANILAAQLHTYVGSVTFHLGSSHLYIHDVPRAVELLAARDVETVRSPALPDRPPSWLDIVLCQPETGWHIDPLDPAWVPYARALLAKTRLDALKCLM